EIKESVFFFILYIVKYIFLFYFFVSLFIFV
ncbi:hypothetical protein, partial [Plasmodium yoelii yoelii]